MINIAVGVHAASATGISPDIPKLLVSLVIKKNKNPKKRDEEAIIPYFVLLENLRENTAAISTIATKTSGVANILWK